MVVRTSALIASMALLAACASTGPAPVDDLSHGAPRGDSTRRAPPPPASGPGGSYRVQRGDTLYSIAFRNGLDYRELASWNGIGAPYTIYVGQEIRLASTPRHAPSAPARPAVASAAPAAPKPAAAGAPKPAPFEDVKPSVAPSAAVAPASAPTTAPTASVAADPATKPAAVAAAPAPASTPTAPSPSVASSGEVAWRWPADGATVAGFVGGDPTRQGIDIAGRSGDPVRAAADGTIVYSGNGLIGYGELIIVKHSPSFLSAYGYNRKRLVKEGDRIKAGQTIAEMGSSSAGRDALHFEIRRNGKPVNPVDYLPRR